MLATRASPHFFNISLWLRPSRNPKRHAQDHLPLKETHMRKKLVLGNWKMNGGSASNARLLEAITLEVPTGNSATLGICVPFLYVSQAQNVLKGSTVRWGIQDVSAQSEGAFTGEISARMARDFDVSFSLVGHSERRTYHAETDHVIAEKVVRCAESNITPVICVGESLKEREDGEANTVIERQLSVALQKISDDQAANVVIAYEPVWAIGTGRSASPEQVQETHAFLRRVLEARSSSLSQVSILYGGSVKVETAADLFRQPDVDGGLVGNASLDASQLLNIFKALS